MMRGVQFKNLMEVVSMFVVVVVGTGGISGGLGSSQIVIYRNY